MGDVSKPICPDCGGTIHGSNCKLCEMFALSATPGGTQTTGWPKRDESLAVHVKQVDQANERNRKRGIKTRYDPRSGIAVIPDAGDNKRLIKLEGEITGQKFVDKRTFY